MGHGCGTAGTSIPPPALRMGWGDIEGILANALYMMTGVCSGDRAAGAGCLLWAK